jgi:hypothetical protein
MEEQARDGSETVARSGLLRRSGPPCALAGSYPHLSEHWVQFNAARINADHPRLL